ncbi:PLP-dependent aminotransferase family protein [Pseudorhodoferax soli]|uniref:2-aminoadipate transaminase n=1 Tax=Pseudorhodoferax soli TaxID=545864 RepID=A0A368X733_9BURK|nr:PLP-dependent aminotransferase family protein [Pseudorhodoferax soli]RCW63615.1 2-aminoadipate transaminase [Pseudorhodoferax soli]
MQLAKKIQPGGGSAIREIAKKTVLNPNIISLAGGLPSPDSFPVEEMRACFDAVLSKQGRVALQYGATDGYLPLRELIASQWRGRGVAIQAENVLITCGSQQGLDLVGRVLVDEGATVFTESPTYLGATQALRAYGPAFVGIGSDQKGLVVDALAERSSACGGGRAGLVYVVPNFPNPSGRTLDAARREALDHVAQSRGLVIVEDDPYAELSFDGSSLPSLLSLSPGNVIHLGSFSKILSPGIRLGFVIAPVHVIRAMEQVKQGIDLHTSGLTQMAMATLLESGFMDGHLQRIRELYARKSQVMCGAVRTHMPPSVRFEEPKGGMFMWLTLPEHIDTTELLPKALAAGVAFVPGAPFYVEHPERNTMRLSFATASDSNIKTGIERIGSLIRGCT